MMTKLRGWWQATQESFWFVPSLIVAGSIALALVLIEDVTGSIYMTAQPWRDELLRRTLNSAHLDSWNAYK
jgi:hypothetical protein